MTYLTDAPIDQQRLAEAVMRPSDGALALFAGVVRNHHEGKSVESIYYECWRPMAEKEMGRIDAEVSSAYPDVAIAFVHRLGLLTVGEASIVIASASMVCTQKIKPHYNGQWIGYKARCLWAYGSHKHRCFSPFGPGKVTSKEGYSPSLGLRITSSPLLDHSQ